MKTGLKQFFYILSGMVFVAAGAHAASSSSMQLSTTVIANLDQAIQEIKNKSKLPVFFPEQVPVPAAGQKYYASWIIRPDGGYYISIDTDAQCNGAKYCSVGSVMADLGKRPEIYYAPNGQDITHAVGLYKGKKGFYTPAHAEADYWPAMVDWRMGNVLYQVSWKLDKKNQQQIVIDLADSAIKKGAR
jgi:hypothetical protein